MSVVKPLPQTSGDSQRSLSWRRQPVHRWRGTTMDMVQLLQALNARRTENLRVAICRFMDDHGVPNTEKGHRHAYMRLWTTHVCLRLGLPPRPRTLVRWRKKRVATEEMVLPHDTVVRSTTAHGKRGGGA